MNRLVQSILVATTGWVTLTALAQNPPPPSEGAPRPPQREGGRGGRGGTMRSSPLMVALDTNKDGDLSADEIANAPMALKTLDKNGDGKLTPEELRPSGPEGERGGPRADNSSEVVARLMENDKNKDGKLSADELPERMRGLMARADLDKDGFLTKEELTKAMARQQEGVRPAGERGERREGGESGQRPPR